MSVALGSGEGPIKIARPILLPHGDARVWSSRLPPFSSVPLLVLVGAKPVADALYDVEWVKYAYMLLLGFTALFARFGQEHGRGAADPRNGSLLAYAFLIALYAAFQFGLVTAYGGSLSITFKVISPFVFFVLLAYAADRWLIYALAVGAVLTIVANAALLPFDFGWVWWGAVRTFKGYYFFKTDLAYSLCFALLIYACYARNMLTLPLAGLILLAAAEVILANSRINYLNLFLVILFLVAKGGLGLRSAFYYCLLFGVLGLAVAHLYDPTRLLGFDFANEAAFTQGRSVTWHHLLSALGDYSPLDWLFGRGQSADLTLSAAINGPEQMAYDAHNEFLHLLYTQGAVGTILYLLLWIRLFRMSRNPEAPQWARGSAMLALTLFLLQSMTSVMSPYATKTWPLVMMLLALRGRIGRPAGEVAKAAATAGPQGEAPKAFLTGRG